MWPRRRGPYTEGVRAVVALCVLLGCGRVDFDARATAGSGALWDGPAGRYRKRLVIDHTRVGAGGVTGFPVAVVLRDADLAALARPDGGDLAFTAGDGVTPLASELESYDAATGALVAWVKVPAVSDVVDTPFYLYFGDAAAGARQPPQAVWDDGFVAVYHLNQAAGGAGAIVDSTANANDATETSGAILGQPGAIGDAVELDGALGELAAPVSASIQTITSALTLEAWIRPTAQSPNTAIVDRWFGSIGGFGLAFDENAKLDLMTSDGAQEDFISHAMALSLGTWTHVVATWLPAPGVEALYLDGAVVASQTSALPQVNEQTDANNALGLGGPNGSMLGYLAGGLDEVRISRVARSAAWIATEYANQAAPASFFAVGALEAQ